VDVELAVALVDAVDGALLEAAPVHDVDAAGGDDERHQRAPVVAGVLTGTVSGFGS
jgi:hypothetical protein